MSDNTLHLLPPFNTEKNSSENVNVQMANFLIYDELVWRASLFVIKLAVCCEPVCLINKPVQELTHYDVALCKEDFSVYKPLLQFHNSINRSLLIQQNLKMMLHVQMVRLQLACVTHML